MGKQKLNIKDLSIINFPSEVAKSLSLNIMNRHFKHLPNEEKLMLIQNVLEHPKAYLNNELLSLLAHKLYSAPVSETFNSYELEDEPKHFDVFGNKHIELNAIKQMELVMVRFILQSALRIKMHLPCLKNTPQKR